MEKAATTGQELKGRKSRSRQEPPATPMAPTPTICENHRMKRLTSISTQKSETTLKTISLSVSVLRGTLWKNQSHK